ncbi:MAG: stage II sporulation protein P [Lachnospiraceae bacterium]|nr:stage II sporulation protein P [Robinsoniella sp.]MDY3767284.1 stage II sporulation protein P [Lachnospiraceae bacterium]
MKDFHKCLQILIGSVIGALGLYILYRGVGIVMESPFFKNMGFPSLIQRYVEEEAASVWVPGLAYEGYEKREDGNWLTHFAEDEIPLYYVAQEQITAQQQKELQTETTKKEEGKDGEEQTEDKKIQSQTETETMQTQTDSRSEPETVAVTAQGLTGGSGMVHRDPVAEIPYDRLGDFDFLLNQYYIVDASTTVDASLLDAETFMEKDFSIEKEDSIPQILIYHTHSQEEFVDSIPGDDTTTIVGVGDYLAELLESMYGYRVIHDRGVYDLIDGVLDREAAYDYSLEAVEQILEENPSIQVVIDLHRDGVEGKKLVTQIDGEDTALLMLFNGLSRLADGTEIDYLPNPYLEDNLAFSFQIQMKAKQFYPDLMRPMYLRGYRYNLHVRPRTLLVEAGTQLNTLQEEKNAMKYFADILNQVLSGE